MTNTDLPNDDKMSRAEQAYQQILDDIREGRLKPGHRITELDIAASLKMSRTPVREALRRLEIAGLISTAPYSGMQIARLGYQEVMELYDMRVVLESTASKLAAKHASDAEIYSLNEIMKRYEAATTAVEQARHNRVFHNALAYAAHNRYLLKSLNSMRDSMILLGKTTFELPNRAEQVVQEHRDIINAIIERNPEKAAEAAAHHIREAQKARIALMGEEIDQEI
ncbi:GntR family transcriptional regulator [uncultured Paenalcaligenes sp.]|uniref:GntR family transcriptional regulator n=1 Tax=uncultured Paenalcaligenes sp. TaxID=1588925 RepID=UPI0026033305|nr:GntR family transcriptional regulator [uncultured Paenalcaligenes sp.]